MRGRRAFVILTIYLLLLGGFAWMIELILERSASSGFGSSTYAGASIGQGIFAALLMLETLQVAFLAPVGDGRGDQPRTREADARPAGGHADLVDRHRPGQAPQRPRLRLAPDRRLDPAHGRRLRVRRRRPRRRPARLHRPRRHGPRARGVRAVLLEPGQADPGRDRDHDLRRPRRVDRVGLRPRVLGRHDDPRQRRRQRVGQGYGSAGDRLPQPVPGGGRRPVRDRDDAQRLVQPGILAPAQPERRGVRWWWRPDHPARAGAAGRRRQRDERGLRRPAGTTDRQRHRGRPRRGAVRHRPRRILAAQRDRLAGPVGRLPRAVRPVRLADPSLAPPAASPSFRTDPA